MTDLLKSLTIVSIVFASTGCQNNDCTTSSDCRNEYICVSGSCESNGTHTGDISFDWNTTDLGEDAPEPDTEESDADTDTTTEIDTYNDPEQCIGRADFSTCDAVTAPDVAYDICINEICASPGSGPWLNNVPGPGFPMPDTNQHSCYDENEQITCPEESDDFYGQDAQYGWDATHETTERFDVSDEVVSDNVTGLMWLRCAVGGTGEDCGDVAVEDGMTWEEAVAHCETLTAGDHEDWRLPSEYELMSIADRDGDTQTAAFEDAFPNTPALSFWTSTTIYDEETPEDLTTARVIRFHEDGTGYDDAAAAKSDAVHYIRCVRTESAISLPAPRYEKGTESEQPVVTDWYTGLMWTACKAGYQGADCRQVRGQRNYTWGEALAYCENLTYDNKSDWRLPSINEWYALADNQPDSASSAVFPSHGVAGWSATTAIDRTADGDGATAAWRSAGVFNTKDAISVFMKTDTDTVTCVRNVSAGK